MLSATGAGTGRKLEGEPDASPARRHARALHDTLYRWIEVAGARVVNRSGPQGSNSSKPYQAQLIASYGLRVPETLITNEPAGVLAFRRAHGSIIYKSMSGVRSIVKVLDDKDLARLGDIGWCPVQFQALVPGNDVRVHVIGRDVYATEIISDVTDYRYACQLGGSATLRAMDRPEDLAGIWRGAETKSEPDCLCGRALEESVGGGHARRRLFPP